MSMHSEDPRSPGLPARRSNVTRWLAGIVAVLIIVGLVFWWMNPKDNVAGREADTNTGSARPTAAQTAPAPGTPTPAGPGAPARP